MRFRVFEAGDRAKFLEKVRQFLRRPRVRRWLRLTDVAKRLDVGTRKLRKMSKAGEFPPVIVKGRISWVDEQQILDWQRQEMQKAAEAPNKKAMRADYVRAAAQRDGFPEFLRG